MKVKEPDFAAVMSLVWRQAPALLVFGFIADLLLVSAVYRLPACDHVLPSGALDTLVVADTGKCREAKRSTAASERRRHLPMFSKGPAWPHRPPAE